MRLTRLFPESAGCEANPVVTALATGLVRDLGDARFAVRERAEQELAAQGPAARDPVARAAEGPDPEVRARAGRILREALAWVFVVNGERG